MRRDEPDSGRTGLKRFPSCRGRGIDVASMNMKRFFDSIRSIGFRRGPWRLLGGIAGGIADRLDINVWLARLLVLLSFLLPVVGVGLYVVVWALTPWQDGSIPLERFLNSRTERR